jgi:hypothetical protein
MKPFPFDPEAKKLKESKGVFKEFTWTTKP